MANQSRHKEGDVENEDRRSQGGGEDDGGVSYIQYKYNL